MKFQLIQDIATEETMALGRIALLASLMGLLCLEGTEFWYIISFGCGTVQLASALIDPV